MSEEVYWYTAERAELAQALRGDTECDAVVVGGGIAGLSAAQWLREAAGREVVLLESRFCGAGATGKSSGFITPDSELELQQLARRFGDADARFLWHGARAGVEHIRSNVDRFGIACDRLDADSLYVANGHRSVSTVRKEHEAHERLGFPSRFYPQDELPQVIGTGGYYAGVRYGGTFSINGYLYAQGLKRALVEQGVRVFEDTPAVAVGPHEVKTPGGAVRARQVFVCMDKYAPDLGIGNRDNYHAQTFLTLSEPLDKGTVRRIFPERAMLVWDTDLIYQYYRLTADNRLLVGGGELQYTFRRCKAHGPNSVIPWLLRYVRRKFPFLRDVPFAHWWPGMIGVTKDLLPMAGAAQGRPNHFYAMCSAGLPWSTLAGRVAAQNAVEGSTPYDRFFDPARAYNPVEALQPVLRKPLTFALSTYYAKNYETGHAGQVARQRRQVRAAAWAAAGVLAGAAGVLAARRNRRAALR